MFVRIVDPLPALPGGPSRATRSYEMRPLRPGRFALRLWGRLPRGWLDALCAGLAHHGVSVESGIARQGEDRDWVASFELSQPPGATDPLLLDLLELMSRRRGSAPPIALEGYALRTIARAGGALALEVWGADQVGFLSGLLERIGFLGLTPLEVRIETDAAGVRDAFVLRGHDGRAPSARAAKLLAEVLDGRLCRAVAEG